MNIQTQNTKEHLGTSGGTNYRDDWSQLVWRAFGAKGMIAATFGFGTMFAEQIRAEQATFPALGLVGECATGKTILAELICKLSGREDFVELDPNRTSPQILERMLDQSANMPLFLVNDDRVPARMRKQHNWDTIKKCYQEQGESPCFRGSFVFIQQKPIDGKDPIYGRIVQLELGKDAQSSDSRDAAIELQRLSSNNLGHSALISAAREQDVLENLKEKTAKYHEFLMTEEGISDYGLSKDYAQMLFLLGQFAEIVGLADEQYQSTVQVLINMAREQQAKIRKALDF